jgi:hypothetical protein
MVLSEKVWCTLFILCVVGLQHIIACYNMVERADVRPVSKTLLNSL